MAKRAYLKKSSSARLLKMLITSQIRRLANRAPAAIIKSRTVKASRVDEQVGLPQAYEGRYNKRAARRRLVRLQEWDLAFPSKRSSPLRREGVGEGGWGGSLSLPMSPAVGALSLIYGNGGDGAPPSSLTLIPDP